MALDSYAGRIRPAFLLPEQPRLLSARFPALFNLEFKPYSLT